MKPFQIIIIQKELNINIEQLRSELQHLKSQKVNSPQKIKEVRSIFYFYYIIKKRALDTSNQIKIEKDNINKLDEDINKLNYKIDQYSMIQNKLQKVFTLMTEIKNSIGREKLSKKDFKDLKKTILIIKEQINERSKESNVFKY